jgi:hypothetical protein
MVLPEAVRHLLSIGTVVFLCFVASYSVKAQTYNRVEINRGDFYLNNVKQTDSQVREILGEEIYNQTYVSAQKQRKLGNILMIAGGATAGVGAGLVIAGAAGAFGTLTHTWYYDPSTGKTWGDQYNYDDNLDKMAPIMMIGYGVLAVGTTVLGGGIAFKIIGGKRLQWVEQEANRKMRKDVSLNIGTTKYGVGITMKF